MVVKCKCIEKFRNKQGRIHAYRLQDNEGTIKDMVPEMLKIAIKENQITVTNLKLTSDNRLIDTKEQTVKQVKQEKALTFAEKKELALKLATKVYRLLGCEDNIVEIKAFDNSTETILDKRYEPVGPKIYYEGQSVLVSVAIGSNIWITLEEVNTDEIICEVKCTSKLTLEDFNRINKEFSVYRSQTEKTLTEESTKFKEFYKLNEYANKTMHRIIDKKELNNEIYINNIKDMEISTDIEDNVKLDRAGKLSADYVSKYEISSTLLTVKGCYMYLTYKNGRYNITIENINEEFKRITKGKITNNSEFRATNELIAWLNRL